MNEIKNYAQHPTPNTCLDVNRWELLMHQKHFQVV